MDIDLKRINLKLDLPQTQREVSSWKMGETMEATVGRKSADGSKITLMIGGKPIEASFSKELEVGQKILVEVVKTQPMVELKGQLPAASPEQLLKQAIQNLIPKQQSIAPLLATIKQLVDQNAQLPQIKTLQPILKQLLPQLLRVEDVTSQPQATRTQTVKQTIENSGAFFEAKLAKAIQEKIPEPQIAHLIKADGKAQLMQTLFALYSLIKARQGLPAEIATAGNKLATPSPTPATTQTNIATPLPLSAGLPPTVGVTGDAKAAPVPNAVFLPPPLPTYPLLAMAIAMTTKSSSKPETDKSAIDALLNQLFRQTESALARVQLTQLGAKSNDSQQQQLNVDIPVAREGFIDHFQLRVEEREASHENTAPRETKRWKISLAFHIPPMAKTQANISLGQDSVSAQLYTTDPTTADTLTKLLPTLSARLSAIGLEVGNLQCTLSEPPKDTDGFTPHGMVHEKV